MKQPPLLGSFAGLLSLLLLALADPNPACGQPLAPGSSELAPEVRERLSQAARDTLLPAWQRDLMLHVARGSTISTLDSVVASIPAPLPAHASDANPGSWAELPVGKREEHSAIYDPVRDRMLVFGGYDGSYNCYNEVWALSLGSAPAWTQLTPSGTPPIARYGHSSVYDPARDRMLVFGGFDGSCRNDVWALSLGSAPAWTQLTPSGTPPVARYGHSSVYDPVRDRMLVFGGYDDFHAYRNDVWALSLAATSAWTALMPSGTPPSGREEHSAIYDPVRDRMLVFGGHDPDYRNDLWALSLANPLTWTALTPSGTPPSARCGHSAIYDPLRDRMLVFGGHPFVAYGVWALSLAGTPAWTTLTPSGTLPSARYDHSAIYDPVRDRMLMLGGCDASGCRSDIWALSLAGTPAWTQLTPNGTPPSGRYFHAAIYGPVGDRMVVFGGTDGAYRNDIWALSLAETPVWTQLMPTGTRPSPRYAHSAIYDPGRVRMLVFGGTDAPGDSRNDIWSLSLAETPVWTQLTPTGTPPSARVYHSAIYDPVRDRMLVFGGSPDGSSCRNDVWALWLEGMPAWMELTPTGTPPSARENHSAIYDAVHDRMVVFGGYDGSYRNDVWALTLAGTPAWAELAPAGTPPSAREDHSAIYDPLRDRMLVFGGASNGPTYFNDVWALALTDTPIWTSLIPTGTPPIARAAHSSIYDPVRDRMLLFGGYPYLNDVWALALASVLGVDDQETRPLISHLRPPAPNPSHGTTTVSYSLARAGRVQLNVYDVSGRMVRRLVNGQRDAGTETVVWDGTSESGARLGTGVYLVQVVGPGIHATRKLILLK